MTDKKSSESRRKLLKSIAAGSGAIVAGKSLPESWSKPVVDSVMLPVHAQTSIICTIDITYEITVSPPIDGDYGYNISYFPGGGDAVPPVVEEPFTSSVNRTYSHTLPPGQYVVSGGAGADSPVGSGGTASGQTSVSCCSASSLLGAPWTVPAGGSDGDGGAVLVTVGTDGTCSIVPTPV